MDGLPHGIGRLDYGDNDDNALYYEGGWVKSKQEGKGKKLWMVV